MSQRDMKRTDYASRVIKARPETIYQAFVDPKALVAWLPPKGMRGEIHLFDVREGGTYRMTLTYDGAEQSIPGKTSDNTDVVQGRFLELVPNERIVQLVEFESDDPAFAGTMTMTWRLSPTSEGTEVAILCENVPQGIKPEDHEAAIASTLANLALYLE